MILPTQPGMDIKDVVDLFMESTEAVNNLWSFYMAGSFAAAGFAASAKRLSLRSAGLITVGYVVFLGGHLSLLDHAITVQRAAAGDLLAALADIPQRFKPSIIAITRAQSSKAASFAIHIGIDLCILGIIWMTALNHEKNNHAKEQ